jgi:hypothetical protein
MIITGLIFAGCSNFPNRYDMMGTIGSWSVPENELTLEQRTVYFNNRSVEDVLAKAAVIESEDPLYNNIKVIVMQGTPYEMGFQNGYLNKDDIRENIDHIIGIVTAYGKSKGVHEDAMDEVYDLIAPYIPIEDKEEMRGLAHGSEIPLRVIHWLHAIPELSEYGGKKQFLGGNKYKQIEPETGSLADPELETCSGVIGFGDATKNGDLYHLRVLDWIRELGAQRYPVIHVYQPDTGHASVSFSYAGFTGCFTGMNEKHMAFGEMGYGNHTFETLEGIPFVFLFKKLLREADSISEALDIVKNSHRTCSYVYQFSDAGQDTADKGVMLVSDYQRFTTVTDNHEFCNEREDKCYEGIKDVIFAGHETGLLREFMVTHYGEHDLETFKELAKVAAMRGNVQDVIMKPGTLEAWMVNASNTSKDEQGKASNQQWYYFNFGETIGQ